MAVFYSFSSFGLVSQAAQQVEVDFGITAPPHQPPPPTHTRTHTLPAPSPMLYIDTDYQNDSVVHPRENKHKQQQKKVGGATCTRDSSSLRGIRPAEKPAAALHCRKWPHSSDRLFGANRPGHPHSWHGKRPISHGLRTACHGSAV